MASNSAGRDDAGGADGSGSEPVAVLAQGLRSLRDHAEGPVGGELEQLTGLGGQAVEDALSGRELPSLAVTLALVGAWGGDVEAWEGYWGQIAELAAPDVEEAAGSGEAEPETTNPERVDVAGAEAETEAGAETQPLATPPAPPLVSDEPGEPDGSTEPDQPDQPDEAEAEQQPAVAVAAAHSPTNPGPDEPPIPAPQSIFDQQPAETSMAGEESKPHPHRAFRVTVALLMVIAAAGGALYGYLTRNDDKGSQRTVTANPTASQVQGSPSSSAGPSTTSTLTAPPTPTPAPTLSAASPSDSLSSSTTPTSSPSGFPSDTATTAFTYHAPGTQLGLYPKVQLPSGYSVDFVNDTFHPVSGISLGGDTMGFFATASNDGRFFAAQAVVFDPTEPPTFERCDNDTRYQQNVEISVLSVGSLFCVHSIGGEVVLVKVDRLPQPQDANPYAVIDLTVWQGP